MEQRAEIIDRQIDNAVYQLYGLTEEEEEEVKIVEGEWRCLFNLEIIFYIER